MRTALLGAFAALVVTASVVAATPTLRPAASVPTTPNAPTTSSQPTGPAGTEPTGPATGRAGSRTHGKAPTTSTPGKRSKHPVPTTTTTTVPGAVEGPVTVSSIGHGCGLSLTPPRSGKPAPVGRCTVLEIGDSMGNDLGWALLRHLSSSSGLHMVQDDTASTGLSNSWFYNWPVHLAADLRQVHPQLVLVSLGGNDEQGMQVGNKVLAFGTPAWQQVYLGYVREIINESRAAGAYVLWVGMPIMGESPGYDEGMALLDSLYQHAALSEPDTTYVSTYALFANPQGQYQSEAAVNGVQTALRSSDNIHYSYAGEDVVATYVIREMARVYHVALTATSPSLITSWS